MHQLEIIENDLKQLQAETKKKHGPLKEVSPDEIILDLIEFFFIGAQ